MMDTAAAVEAMRAKCEARARHEATISRWGSEACLNVADAIASWRVIECNLPFERIPQSAEDTGFGPAPALVSELTAGLREIKGFVGHHGLVPAERNVVCTRVDALLEKVESKK